jgi:hypothetical protein
MRAENRRAPFFISLFLIPLFLIPLWARRLAIWRRHR